MTALQTYLATLQTAYGRGDATEHTHRAALQALIEASGKHIAATNEPKAAQRENKPDYVIRKGAAIIGFVEAKDIGIELKATLKTAQLKRYCEALPNLILTNYVDFVWIVRGEQQLAISLGRLNEKACKITPAADAAAQWDSFINFFFNEVTPTVDSPKALAQILGGQTRLLRDLVGELVDIQDSELTDQYRSFQTLLLPDISPQEFADMYAQTAAYGLFTARVFEFTHLFGAAGEPLPPSQKDAPFSLEKSPYLIPKANPFLRQFFQHIASPNLNPQLRWLIEQIASGLHYVDMDKVLHVQGRKLGFEDPVFHFYESFLAEYDRALRESRGVYYTPEPVVDFIVRGVDWLLKEKLGKPQGLADKDTLILDPAAGTATFLRKVIDHIHASVTAKNAGVWPDYVRERLLPRIFGFELMMAPYTVAHLKLALQLQEQGFVFGKGADGKDERLNVYLTNTLDTIHKQTDAYMSGWIAAENLGAEAVKRSKPVQVVLGNPPYSGESRNKGEWISGLLDAYKQEPTGGKLQERNSKWINDDYVKFIRFAHDRIARTGHGIVAFITNHGWLDNPTFRGMRASLMRDFDDIYVMDLHGNSKKKERTPAALAAQGDDKNVFDIEQGVSMVFMVKAPSDAAPSFALGGSAIAAPSARIYHHELWGSRENKYNWLHEHSLASTPWTRLTPALPHLLLVPRNEDDAAEYQRGWAVTDILAVNSVGIVTARDALTIQFDRNAVSSTVKRFAGLPTEEARIAYDLGADVRDWRVDWAQQDLKSSGLNEANIVPVAYRPFDTRFTYYTGKSKGFHCMPRSEVMEHLIKLPKNFYLGVCRQMNGDNWVHTFIGEGVAESGFISNRTSEIGSVFPLWLAKEGADPKPNLDVKFLEQLATSLNVASLAEQHHLPEGVAAEDVLAYLYAVLHAPSYRARYAEFLKSDFPRLPIAVCAASPQPFAAVWQALLPLGRELIALHLLKTSPDALQPQYPQSGNNGVEKPRYDEKTQRVYLNATQYFDGVPPATWAFKVGGYQVCEKWLKDRKGRTLTLDDIEHYQKTVAALTRTQTLMQAVDAIVVGTLWPANGT